MHSKESLYEEVGITTDVAACQFQSEMSRARNARHTRPIYSSDTLYNVLLQAITHKTFEGQDPILLLEDTDPAWGTPYICQLQRSILELTKPTRVWESLWQTALLSSLLPLK